MHYISRAALASFVLIGAAAASLLLIAAPVFAQTATPDVVKNIKTDFGAKCDGVADDQAAFWNFHN
jgi:hypothetical protein